jgi:DNA-binding transcriptional LysR family regulator
MASLAHLQTFLAVYRSGSLTAAAAQLHLSQPAVSGHLRALEAERGRPLFLREPRGVAATSEAHALAAAVAPHLDALEVIRQQPTSSQVPMTVHVGGPADLLAARALPSLAPLLNSRIRVRTRTGIAEPLLEALARDELDLVIATRSVPHPQLTFEPLFVETLVLIAAPRWAARLAPQAIETNPVLLEDIPLVAFDEDLALARDLWASRFGRSRRLPVASLTVADLRAVCATVAAGAGIGVVPRYIAADALATGSVVEIAFTDRPATNTIHLAERITTTRRAGVEQVKHLLHHAAPGWERGR